MKASTIFSQSHRHTSYIMDIIICIALCLVKDSLSYSLPKDRRDVKLIPNSFQVIVQSSLPTSLPRTLKAKPYKSQDVRNSYQSDQGYAFTWPVEETIDEDKERTPITTPCKLSCTYGFEEDIEGNELCKCKDPCKGVKCFGGSKCEPKRECIFDKCKFTAVCKVADNVCSLPKPKYTFMCDKLSKRYYFDTKKGLCRKFWGCADITGNSFDNKKACKSMCYSKEQKQRDRKARKNRKNSKESWSSQVSSELADNDMSNVVPTYKNLPSINNLISEGFEEKNNQIESNHKNSQYPNIFTHQVPGLNQLSGCPEDSPYEKCPFDPCAGCSSSNIMCFTSFCGKCKAIYIDLRTGEASDKFAANC